MFSMYHNSMSYTFDRVQYFIIMWIPTNKTKRFTLYHLEENEIYIRDFSGFCTYLDPTTKEEKPRDKGKFYICSKTIVFQSEQSSVPLLKLKYQHMKSEPKLITDKKSSNFAHKPQPDTIMFDLAKVTSIKVTSLTPPEPFRLHDEYNHRIVIQPTYEDATRIIDWVHQLFAYSKKKNVYDLEDKIYDWIKQKENKSSFNMSLIESVSEKPQHEETNIFVRRILPLNHLYGYFFVTDQRIYFQPFHSISGQSVVKIDISDVTGLFKRRYELREIGLEVITQKNSYYFTFDSITHRNRLYNSIVKKVPVNCNKEQSLEKITYLWQTKQITNYEYLMHLNQSGNRSFSDLSQYPVFPWVISQYTEQQIDLNDQSIYRDLTKPIGALNEDRLQGFLERYQDMPPPKFMYGSHYSAPGYVIGYLVRKKPQYMLKLQSGKFDKPDRLFKSIKGDWKNVIDNPTSLKQLIPQFYQNDASFLVNKLNLDLGVRQNKKKVVDVKLPKWAKGSPQKYLEINRKALQSEYVSNNLHHWIDLIFGYKQRGQEAIKANNLFNYMTYEGMVDVEAIKDPIEKMSVKCQINEFGQCPKQIFKIPHPARNALVTNVPETTHPNQNSDDSEKEVEYQNNNKNKMMNNVQTSSLYSSAGRPKVKTAMVMGKPSDIKTVQIQKAHKSLITKILPLPGKPNHVVTIGQDGFLKLYNLVDKNCLKSFKICDYCLSAIVPIKGDELFAIGSWNNSLYLFNVVFGSCSQPYKAHDNSISDLLYLQKKKRLVSSSWDCSIKTLRIVGNNFDNQDIFCDHDNQITNLAATEDEQILAFGDIEGNIIVMNINQKQKLFQLNFNSQKVIKLQYLSFNLCAISETQIRLLDPHGNQITNFMMQKSNGTITDAKLDSEHLFVITNKKHLGLYDLLQQKKLSACFNDYRFNEEDKLPLEKQLTAISVVSESTIVVVGTSTGNMYMLRS